MYIKIGVNFYGCIICVTILKIWFPYFIIILQLTVCSTVCGCFVIIIIHLSFTLCTIIIDRDMDPPPYSKRCLTSMVINYYTAINYAAWMFNDYSLTLCTIILLKISYIKDVLSDYIN